MPNSLQLDPIAIFEHDFGGKKTLFSYPPVPAKSLHQGEILAQNTFGSLLADIKSPAHIYFAAWRDPAPDSRLDERKNEAPTALLFTAQFGIAPYETTGSLVETAEMFNRLDRAHLRIDCARDADDSLRLKSLILEIVDQGAQTGRPFRSCWHAEELRDQDLTLQFDEPTNRLAPFRFTIQGRLPGRFNHGEKLDDEFVSFSSSGGAMPLPQWVNY